MSGLEATGRKRPSLLLVTDGDRLSEELTTTLRVGDLAISRLLSLGWTGNLGQKVATLPAISCKKKKKCDESKG